MSAYSSRILGLGPVSYYRLGEPSGTTLVDETAANTGTYVNTPTFGNASQSDSNCTAAKADPDW